MADDVLVVLQGLCDVCRTFAWLAEAGRCMGMVSLPAPCFDVELLLAAFVVKRWHWEKSFGSTLSMLRDLGRNC
jgi:hypothetical protein